MKTGTLQVPGASLYYEVRGSGPVLLMIPGGRWTPTGSLRWRTCWRTSTRS
jgi:hypothetical protein